MVMRDMATAASVCSVLVCSKSGSVERAFGTDLGIANVFLDPRLESCRPQLIAGARGGEFATVTEFADRGSVSVRVIQQVNEGEPGLCVTISSESVAGDPLSFVADNMRQGLWRVEPDGTIAFVNAHLADWLDAKPSELIGRQASEFRGKQIAASRTHEHRFEMEFVTRAGVGRRAVVDTYTLRGAGRGPAGYIQIVTDVMGDLMRTRLMQEVQAMTRLARTDPLTGLSNRLEFDDALEFLQDPSSSQPFAMIYADLDNLKEINDRLGHEWGDVVLVEVAQHVRAALRDTDVVARLGGDEFGILLPGTSFETGKEIVRRLEQKLQFNVDIGEDSFAVTVSVGMAHSDEGRDSVAKRADQRMYRQKKRRKQANLA